MYSLKELPHVSWRGPDHRIKTMPAREAEPGKHEPPGSIHYTPSSSMESMTGDQDTT